ncbi:MAG: helix-turn-helix transcriptional regulator [Planctomycetaceae bacterium]
MKPDSMDAVFQALSNASRRRILDLVKGMPGCNVNDVCKYFDVSRIAVMKHLNVLEAARLILSEKHGRSRELYFNAAPIQMIYDRWTTEYSSFWASQVTDLKFKSEQQQKQKGNAANG